MASIVQVARLAGVSTSTVSHVLNGTRHVEPATRQKVEAAIEATSYRQDALARAMRRAKTDTIGLVVSDAGEPAFAEMVHGVEHAAARHGYTLLLANSAEDPDREKKAVQALLGRRVDGLILARASGSHDDILTELASEKTPVVLMDRLSSVDLDQVGVQNREAVAQLTTHLLNKGRRIALIAGDTTVATLAERQGGFDDALAAAGVEVPSSWRLVGRQIDALRSQLGVLLDSAQRPTAVVASGTVLAAAALAEIQRRGLHIPDDIAFATFDGFAYSDLFSPQLTTIRQPAFTVGSTAVDLLLRRLDDDQTPQAVVRLQPVIEFRASTEA